MKPRQDERPATTGLPREIGVSPNPQSYSTYLRRHPQELDDEQGSVLREYDPRELLAEMDAAMDKAEAGE